MQCGTSVFCDGGVISWLGHHEQLPAYLADVEHDVVDMSDKLVTPGFINTHHHMYQSLTKCMARESELFEWLSTLFPMWEHMMPDMIYKSARFAMAELLLSGCTFSTDHLYLYPNGITLDDTIRAAKELGMRFQPCRGAVSRGKKNGGLAPDSLVEKEDAVLADMRRVIEKFHDPRYGAMIRIALAPCSPFTVSEKLMRDTATLARQHPEVLLHTHLAENSSDISYMQKTVQKTLIDYLESCGWNKSDCWFAHCVHLDPRESIDTPTIKHFAKHGLGVSHCPVSNCRLASGVAPVRKMLDCGVKVSLGVDGSASNDSGSLLSEARMALMLARARDENPKALSTLGALRMATSGGAAVLGRTDVGRIKPGMCADIVGWRLDSPTFAGSFHDPEAALSALILGHGGSMKADYVMVNGRAVVIGGELCGMHTMEVIVKEHNEAAKELYSRHARALKTKTVL